MNVYDFDGTIYAGDCSIGFGIWFMNRHPYLWITFFPKALRNLIRYKRGKMTRTQMSREYLKILCKVKNFDRQIDKFWNKNEKKIASWYLAQKKKDDLIISASPTCIIEPIAKRLDVNYVATEFDRETGVFLDNFMFAKSKARYMIEHDFPVIDNFYSDSLSDTPMALCAEKAYFVTNNAQQVEDWPHLDAETLKEVHKKIDIGWTIHI